MADVLLLKIKIGKRENAEMRRTTITTPKTFQQFADQISAFLDLPNRAGFKNGMKIKYEDDEGDLISLYNDADLEEAMRQVRESSDKLLRITVTALREKTAEEKSPCKKEGSHCKRDGASAPTGRRCPYAGAGRPSHPFMSPLGPLGGLLSQLKVSLPELLNNPALRAMAEGLIGNSSLVKIVTPYVCDNCNGQISGDRYHSTTNDNFDLCSVCFQSPAGQRLNEEHKFNKVPALDALIHCLSNGGSFDAFFANGNPGQEEPVAHRAVCDVCDAGIVGLRFKCMDCADYDECNPCHAKSKHTEGHVFYTIEDPSVRTIPEDVLRAHQAQKDAAAKAVEAERLAREAEAQAKSAAEAAARARSRMEPVAPIAVKQPVPVPVPAPEPVVEQPKPVAPPLESKREREPSEFEKNLETLGAMGFSDRRRCLQALCRNRNNLFETIQDLLNQ